jgi:hypothetical protein
MAGLPNGKSFWVDVKGLSSKNAWLISPKEDRNDLYYILVLLAPLVEAPEVRQPDRFFVLTQAETKALSGAYDLSHPNTQDPTSGFGFKDPQGHEDAWHKLPC